MKIKTKNQQNTSPVQELGQDHAFCQEIARETAEKFSRLTNEQVTTAYKEVLDVAIEELDSADISREELKTWIQTQLEENLSKRANYRWELALAAQDPNFRKKVDRGIASEYQQKLGRDQYEAVYNDVLDIAIGVKGDIPGYPGPVKEFHFWMRHVLKNRLDNAVNENARHIRILKKETPSLVAHRNVECQSPSETIIERENTHLFFKELSKLPKDTQRYGIERIERKRAEIRKLTGDSEARVGKHLEYIRELKRRFKAAAAAFLPLPLFIRLQSLFTSTSEAATVVKGSAAIAAVTLTAGTYAVTNQQAHKHHRPAPKVAQYTPISQNNPFQTPPVSWAPQKASSPAKAEKTKKKPVSKPKQRKPAAKPKPVVQPKPVIKPQPLPVAAPASVPPVSSEPVKEPKPQEGRFEFDWQ